MSSKYILAIETSSSICGVAVIHNNEVLSIEEKDVRRKHAELLPGLTKASLSKMTKAQLDELGKKEFNIDLDRRKAKAVLVKTLLDAQKRK